MLLLEHGCTQISSRLWCQFFWVHTQGRNCQILEEFYFWVWRKHDAVFHSGRTILFPPRVLGFLFLHTLDTIYCFPSSPNGCEGYLTVVSFYVSLMLGEVEHLFMCLLASPASLEKHLVQSLIQVVCFLVLSLGSSLHILGINSLSDIWSAHIFPILYIAFSLCC